jgi:hypothetical protein
MEKFPQHKRIDPQCVEKDVMKTYLAHFQNLQKSLGCLAEVFPNARSHDVPIVEMSEKELSAACFQEGDLRKYPQRFIFVSHDKKMTGIGLKYIHALKGDSLQKNGQIELLHAKDSCHMRRVQQLQPWSVSVISNQAEVFMPSMVYLKKLWSGQPCGNRDVNTNQEQAPYVINGKGVVRLMEYDDLNNL